MHIFFEHNTNPNTSELVVRDILHIFFTSKRKKNTKSTNSGVKIHRIIGNSSLTPLVHIKIISKALSQLSLPSQHFSRIPFRYDRQSVERRHNHTFGS